MSPQTDVDWPSHVDFQDLGFAIMRRESSRANVETRKRRFISWFGMEPIFVALTWCKLHESGWLNFAGKRPKPVHLLWTLNWLRCYHVEDIGSAIAGVDEKTYREKVWFYAEGIARLDTAVVSSRRRGAPLLKYFQVYQLLTTLSPLLTDSVG